MDEWLKSNSRRYHVMMTLLNYLLKENFYPVPTDPADNAAFREDHTQAILELLESFSMQESLTPLKVMSTGPLYQPETRRWADTIDVEVLGPDQPSLDQMVLSLIHNTLDTVTTAASLQMVLGHVGILDHTLQSEGITAEQRQIVRRLLTEGNFVDAETLLKGQAPTTLSRIIPRDFASFWTGLNPDVQAHYDYLPALQDAISPLSVLWDLSLTGHWSYYTGLVFAVYAPGVGHPLLNGGRFTMNTGKRQWSGIGFTMYLDPIFRSIEKEAGRP